MDPLRVLHPDRDPPVAPREWLVANGLGGYACGTLAGPPIRRYHGWLVAALPPPLGRAMLVNRLEETLHPAGSGGAFTQGGGAAITLGAGGDGDAHLTEFRLELGLPVWRFEWEGGALERRVVMEHGKNVTHLRWRLLDGPAVTLSVRPWIQARPHGTPVDSAPAWGEATAWGPCLTVHVPDLPPLRLDFADADALAQVEDQKTTFYYANEDEGGDPAYGPLWSPGHLSATLCPGGTAHLRLATDMPAATDPWVAETARRRALLHRAHPALRQGMAAELVLAADSFVVVPRHRGGDGKARSIIAGYHWFADWGRDTMIALEGLTLLTGRAEEAKRILAGFAAHVRDGLVPNMFPDGTDNGLYNTADASLWFFHAVDRVFAATGDRDFLAHLLPVLEDMIAAHRAGTRFGIAMDPADGLLRQGEDGVQLTWMDAKVEDWVVTPRRGKAVEINALWHNALCCLAGWRQALGQPAGDVADLAARVRTSFNRRFWAPELGYLRDVVDGPDGDEDMLRPNQLLAISLPHPVADPAHWPLVARRVRAELLTPCGLRSLAPSDPAYRPHFLGDRWARDGAYHQGTVWAWLIGPFVETWLRAFPGDHDRVRADLLAFAPHLDQFGIGSIAEVFDGAPPHHPRGCVSQAWSVAEWLRAWALCQKT